MLSFPAAIKVYLCTVACDMRRSFDGLSMMAEHIIRCNPFSGHLLVFCNRRSDRVRIPAMPITRSDLMAITIPSDADHRRSEATLGCSYHAEVIGIRQSFCG
jgi:transposase